MRKIGAHVSASGGIDKAIERAAAIGADCVQVFAGSPRLWKRLPLESVDVDKLFAKCKELSVSPVFTHSLYLVNFASDNSELLAKSIAAVKNDMAFDSLVKGSGVVVHLGSHLGKGWDAVKEQVKQAIITVLNETPADSCLLIENSAGQNGKLCSDLSEIKWLLDEIEKDKKYVSTGRLGWCFDTCHGWAAGYWIGSDEQWKSFQKSESLVTASEEAAGLFPEPPANAKKSYNLYSELDRLYLWKNLKLIHLNDSRDIFNSGRDRHDNIQEGLMYQGMLEYCINYAEIITIPIITEVPGEDGEGPDKINVDRIKKLAGL